MLQKIVAHHSITPWQLQTIQHQLPTFGAVRPDGKGKHQNRPHSLSDETR